MWSLLIHKIEIVKVYIHIHRTILLSTTKPLHVYLQGEKGNIGDTGASGSPGVPVSIFIHDVMFYELLYWTNHIVCYISLTGTSGTSRSRGTSRNKGRNGRNPTYIAYVHLYEKGNSFSIVELVCTDIKLFGTFNQNINALNTRENTMVNSQKKLKQSWRARNQQGVEYWPFPLIILQQAV